MPTAHTLPATFGLDYSVETEFLEFRASSVTLIFDDEVSTLDYQYEDDYVRPALLLPAPLDVELGGYPLWWSELFGMSVEFEISRLTWDGGSTVLLQVFETPSFDGYGIFPYYGIADAGIYIAELGGDPLPDFATSDEFPFTSEFTEFMDDNLGGFEPIPEGAPFGPGRGITLADLPDVEITQRDALRAPTELADELIGDIYFNRIDGLGGNDTIGGGLGDDYLLGGEGGDLIRGDAGFDTLEGGPGADTLEGGADDDVYIVDSQDRVIENPGTDSFDIVETTTNFRLRGPGIERLEAFGAADVRLDGTSGDEELVGNEGDNILVGLGGADTMYGYYGADTFVLTGQLGTAPDVYIEDFETPEGDRIAVDDQLLGIGAAGIDIRDLTPDVFREIKASGVAGYNARNGELLIDVDGDGTREVVAELAFGQVLTLEDFLLF